MNTNMVASELGVSAKTVQRWVKQLNLPAERNELGHYSFTVLKQLVRYTFIGFLFQLAFQFRHPCHQFAFVLPLL